MGFETCKFLKVSTNPLIVVRFYKLVPIPWLSWNMTAKLGLLLFAIKIIMSMTTTLNGSYWFPSLSVCIKIDLIRAITYYPKIPNCDGLQVTRLSLNSDWTNCRSINWIIVFFHVCSTYRKVLFDCILYSCFYGFGFSQNCLYSMENKALWVGGDDGNIYVLSLQTMKRTRILQDHTGALVDIIGTEK